MTRKVLVSVLIAVLLSTGLGGYVARAADPPAHPYLYFSQEELTNLRALQAAPSHQAIWNSIKSWADAHISDPPLVEPTGQSWRTWFDTAANIRQHIETTGFMYAMTEDTDYADAAKDWMLSISGWSAWGTGGSWDITQSATRIILGFCFSYDVLYDYLTASERDTIRAAIIRHTDFIHDAWVGQANYEWTSYPNCIAVWAGAVGMAALALGNEYEGTERWLDFGITDAELFLRYGGADGGYYEGAGYASYSMDSLMPFLDALKRVTGQDLFAGNNFLVNNAYYFIYLTYNRKPLQFEDCVWREGYSPGSLTFIYKLASEYNNPYAQWFADNYASQSMALSFIWKNPDIAAIGVTELPLTKHFSDTGYAIARSGWGNSDLLLAFKSGSSRGHAHPSQNEFAIYYKGKPITCGVGYVSDGSPLDATWTHSCILVDGLGQAQEPGDLATAPLGTRGQILVVDVHDPYYRYMLGDASAVYTGISGVGNLTKCLRHVVFMVNPNYFVIFDQLEAPTAKQFTSVLNMTRLSGGGSSISVIDDLVTLNQQGVKLQVMVVEPDGFTHEIIPYADPWGPTRQIRVSTPVAAPTGEFLTSIFPDAVLPATEVKIGNCLGVIIDHDETRKDVILFSSDGGPVDQHVELGDYYEAIDGQAYTFEDTGVRAQFSGYQVMRLEEQTGTNHAPVLEPIGDKDVDEGQLLEFTITATDPDGDSLTYSASNLPEGADFDPATQTFSWTPASGQEGIYPNVHFEVTDGSLTDAEDITITVNSAEVTPPVMSFIPPTDDDKAIVDRDWTEINVSVDSTLDTSSFIDWNKSLVGYWNLNENSGSVANDKSTYGNNGILANGPQWTDGKFGNALEFLNDDDYLLIEDSESMDFDKSEGTIEMWVYPFDKASGAFQRLVMDSNWDFGNSPDGIELAIQPGGDLYFYPAEGGGNNYNLVTDPFNNNEWQHLTVTWDYSTKEVLIYINGVSQSLTAENVPDNWDSVAQTGDWHVGGTNLDIAGKFFNGLIDEVRIWNRVLSLEEIQASYNTKIHSLSQQFSNLANGTYEYYAYTTDLTGNLAQTETRTLTIETTPSSYPPGDANGDGSVNSQDINKVERIIMGLDEPTPGADANEDGNIDTLDITSVELIITGAW